MDAPSYADATRTAILIYSDAAIGMPSAPWRPYDREASRAAYLRRVERKVRQHYPNVTIVAVYVNDVQRLAVVMDDDPTPPGVYRMSDGIKSMAWDIGQYGFDGWAVPVPVIASGGVGTLDHLVDGVKDGHASAVLAASIFHFGTYTIGEAKRHMAAAGLKVRLDA